LAAGIIPARRSFYSGQKPAARRPVHQAGNNNEGLIAWKKNEATVLTINYLVPVVSLPCLGNG
jgi:hypothetical protein